MEHLMEDRAKHFGALTILLAFACSSSNATNGKDGGESPDGDAASPTPDASTDSAINKDAVKTPDVSADAATAYLSDPKGGIITRLQVQGRNLYWISGYHRIVKASLDDRTITTLYAAPGTSDGTVAIADFATDGTNAYIAYDGDKDYANRGVYQLPLDGSAAPNQLTSSPNPNVTYPNTVAVSGDDVCYSELSAIRHVKTSGGNVTTMVQDRGSPYDGRLLVKDGYVYFTMAIGGSLARDDVYRWPIGVPAPAGVDGGSPGGTDAGGPTAAPEKVSLVPGNYTILLGRRIDQGFVYWSVQDTVYRTDGSSPATEVFTGGSPLQPSDTGIGYCVFPFEGAVYWGHGTFGGTERLFKQEVGVAGNGTLVASIGASDMVADSDYLYVASGSDVWRLPR
jgi:hypothetical protein